MELKCNLDPIKIQFRYNISKVRPNIRSNDLKINQQLKTGSADKVHSHLPNP